MDSTHDLIIQLKDTNFQAPSSYRYSLYHTLNNQSRTGMQSHALKPRDIFTFNVEYKVASQFLQYTDHRRTIKFLNSITSLCTVLPRIIEQVTNMNALCHLQDVFNSILYCMKEIVQDSFPRRLHKFVCRSNRLFKNQTTFFKQHEIYLYIADIYELSQVLAQELDKDHEADVSRMCPTVTKAMAILYSIHGDQWMRKKRITKVRRCLFQ